MELFGKIYDYITTVANGLFAYIDTKEKARDNLLLLIASACIEYEKKGEFKRVIDEYVKLKIS